MGSGAQPQQCASEPQRAEANGSLGVGAKPPKGAAERHDANEPQGAAAKPQGRAKANVTKGKERASNSTTKEKKRKSEDLVVWLDEPISKRLPPLEQSHATGDE